MNKDRFRKKYEMYDVLVLCANDVEYSETKTMMEEQSKDSIIYENFEGQNILFGLIGGKKVASTKLSSMGTLNENAVLTTLIKLSEILTISSIFMVGVCAGIKKEAKIGDVILSKEVVSYSVGKVKDGLMRRYHFIHRGKIFYPGNIYKTIDSILASERFKFSVEKGMVLSGDILLNSRRLKKILVRQYPNAIGLEMEGVGLALASSLLNHNNWLLIKGVSDIGFKKKGSENQDIAVKNALKVLEKVLRSNEFAIYEKNNIEEKTRNVLISGSFVNQHKLSDDVETFSYKLSQSLVRNNFKVVTGYGMVIGPAVVAGAYDMAKKCHYSLSTCLSTFPFPRSNNKEIQANLNAIKTDNRMTMTRNVKYAIFIYGYKENVPNNMADGMKDELYYAQENDAICIPIASTGFTAEKLWKIVKKEWDIYHPNANDVIKLLYDELETKSLDEAIDIVIKIINEYEKINKFE